MLRVGPLGVRRARNQRARPRHAPVGLGHGEQSRRAEHQREGDRHDRAVRRAWTA